jgi:hypothetical protein
MSFDDSVFIARIVAEVTFTFYTTGCTTVFVKLSWLTRLFNINRHIDGSMTGWMLGSKNQTRWILATYNPACIM